MGPDNGTPQGNLPRMYSSLFVNKNFINGCLDFGGWVEALRMKSVGYVTLRYLFFLKIKFLMIIQFRNFKN
jgi:hypothetical protein